MKKILAAVLTAFLAVPALAQQQSPRLHTLIGADAAPINGRRSADWMPKVKAGDVLAVEDTLRIIG